MAQPDLKVILGADTAQLTKELDKASKQVGIFGVKTQKALVDSFKVVATATAGLGAMAVRSAIQVDEAFSKIAGMTGRSVRELESYRDSFKTVFSNVSADADTAAAAFGSVMRTFSGMGKEGIEALSEQVLNLNQIIGVGAEQATSGLGRVMGAFNIPASEAAATMDKLYTIVSKTGIPFEKLTTVMSANSEVAKANGYNMEEFGASLGVAFKNGAKVEEEVGEKLLKAFLVFAKEAGGLNGTLDGTAGAINTIAEDSQTLQQKFSKTMHTLTVALEPVGKELLDWAEEKIPALQSAVEDIDPKMAEMALKVGAVATAFGVLGGAVGKLAGAWKALKALGPIPWIVAAAGYLGTKMGTSDGSAGGVMGSGPTGFGSAVQDAVHQYDKPVPFPESSPFNIKNIKTEEERWIDLLNSGTNQTDTTDKPITTTGGSAKKKSGGSGKKKTAELSAREEALKRLTDEQKKLNREEQIGIELESIMQERMGHTNESLALGSDIANKYSGIVDELNEKARVWMETWDGSATSIADYLGFGEGEREAGSEIANTYDEINASIIPLNEEAQKLQENISKMGENSIDLSAALSSWQSDLAGSFAQAIANGENLGDVLQGLLKDIGTLILKSMILNAISGIFGGGGAPAGWTSVGGIPMHADGAAFVGGRVAPFARGGIVTAPTLFPMASGAGLMGEAGPEAVMPLERIGGKLGVHADISGGGDAPNVTVQVINQSGTPLGASQQSVTKDPVSKDWVVSVIVNDINSGGAVRKAIKRG